MIYRYLRQRYTARRDRENFTRGSYQRRCSVRATHLSYLDRDSTIISLRATLRSVMRVNFRRRARVITDNARRLNGRLARRARTILRQTTVFILTLINV